ncbi:hypothetical protein D9599_28475 [Roseomonas sp. KE2513]|uniref:hypothetical protein n=1 Tax=Roseomonas sp. KE2513 TaxID=2479202 RepID=UPI0018DFDE5B|nr:hypothetical protein [Roseomonas sp. KE2513]MBI0539456.1 hypothetical protein [Roseomonas sp. KE2513]
MSQLLKNQLTKLQNEALACREAASQTRPKTAAEALLETARAFEQQAAALQQVLVKQGSAADMVELNDEQPS